MQMNIKKKKITSRPNLEPISNSEKITRNPYQNQQERGRKTPMQNIINFFPISGALFLDPKLLKTCKSLPLWRKRNNK